MKLKEQIKNSSLTPGEMIFSITLICIAIGFIFWSYKYIPKVRQLPLMVGYIMLAVALADFIIRFKLSSKKVGAKQGFIASIRPEVMSMMWMFGLIAGIFILGFSLMIPSYIFLSIFIRGKKSAIQSGIIATGFSIIIWFVFSWLLNHELYRGLLFSQY